MSDFNHVVIIFNPNSTGDSPEMAKDLASQLAKEFPKLKIDLKETKHAGHAKELAFQAAKDFSDVLIVSVSGDGGYHEVVNGAMQASREGKQPICAVLPGGNANDHHSNVYDRPLMEAIKDGKVSKLDLLKIEIGDKLYYAHSYAGLGITPLVAIELNRHDLSFIKEIFLAIKTFWKFKPFKIEIDGKIMSFDSFIIANIGIMAKYLTLDENSSPRDGEFEVIQWPHSHKLKLIFQLIKSAVGRGKIQKSVSSISFKALSTIPMQLDGEIVTLKPNEIVSIKSAQKVLRTIR